MSPHHRCEQPERHAISSARVVPRDTQAVSSAANALRTALSVAASRARSQS
jgi:hypothetical protein